MVKALRLWWRVIRASAIVAAEKMIAFLSLLAIAITLTGIALHIGISPFGWWLIFIAGVLTIFGIGQLIPYTIVFGIPVGGMIHVKFRLPWWKKLLRIWIYPALPDITALIKIEYPDGWIWTTKAIWQDYGKEITIVRPSIRELQVWQMDNEGRFFWLPDTAIPDERRRIPNTFNFYVYLRDSEGNTFAHHEGHYVTT